MTNNISEKLKEQINIVDLAKRLGYNPNRENKIKSIYNREEKTPSLKLNPTGINGGHSFFKCFSTGKGGDIFDFYGKTQNLNTHNKEDFKRITKELADMFGVTIHIDLPTKEMPKLELWTTNKQIPKFYDLSQKNIDLIKEKRNIDYNLLKEEQKILIKQDGKGNIVLLYTIDYEIKCYQTWYPEAQKGESKYKLGYGTSAKDTYNLGGLDIQKTSNDLWIVEGFFDMLSIQLSGFNCVCSFNANANTKELTGWIERNQNHFSKVILALDDDKAGTDGTNNIIHHLEYKTVDDLIYTAKLRPQNLPIKNGQKFDCNDVFKQRKITIDDFLIAKEHGEKRSKIDEFINKGHNQFWQFDEKKSKVNIIFSYLTEYLEFLGLHYHYNEKLAIKDTNKSHDEAKLVYFHNNVVTNVAVREIVEIVFSSIRKSQTLTENQIHSILEQLQRGINTYFSMSQLSLLPKLNKPELRSDYLTTYHAFKNCVVMITKNGVSTLEYKYLKGYIWRSKIIDRDFNLDLENYNQGDFYKFIANTQRNDTKKVNTFCQTLGYITSDYHTSMSRKLTIFVDGEDTEAGKNNGRRGKSIVYKALEQYLPTCSIQANDDTFKIDRFWLQSYKDGDRLLVFNDLKGTNVQLQAFYTLVDSVEIEKKGRDKIVLDKHEIPLTLITCNHLPRFKADEKSALDRIQIIEFSTYYSPTFNPYHEFGDELGEWSRKPEQWHLFDNFMIWCCLKYKQEGMTHSLGNYAINTALNVDIGTDRVEAFDKLLENLEEVIIDNNFIRKFNIELELDPDTEDYKARGKLVDKKHCINLLSLWAGGRGWKRFKEHEHLYRNMAERPQYWKKVI